MKKYIFTESQIKHIINNVIAEGNSTQLREQQEEEVKHFKAIQMFLNQRLKLNPPLRIDGINGTGTQKGIMRYQTLIGVYPVDGVWGQNTYNKMPPNDKAIFDEFTRSQGDMIDKILDIFK